MGKEIEKMKLEGQEVPEVGSRNNFRTGRGRRPDVDDVHNSVILKTIILHFESHD